MQLARPDMYTQVQAAVPLIGTIIFTPR